MENESIIERVRRIAIDVAGKSEIEGLEIVHQELAGEKRNLTIRIYIDKPNGVTIEDCSVISKRIEEVLDADDFIPSAYMLEVSSPGLERGLYSLKDFERFTGERAKLKTSEAVGGKKVFIGRIVAVDGNEVVFDDKATETVRLPYETITKANLRVDLEKEFKKN